jgi:uncharacterized SAM-binding protein YcdF (DUF218 family)
MMPTTDSTEQIDHQIPGSSPIGKRQPLHKTLFANRGRAGEGLVLGALIGLCGHELGLGSLVRTEILQDFLLFPAIIGILIALSPARKLLRIASLVAVLIVLIVAYTPLTSYLTPSLLHTDPLQPAPAIVVLSSHVHVDNTLDAAGQERILQGYLLLRQGYAGRLVLTHAIPGIGDEVPVIRDQMLKLGMNYPIDEVGPVADTHDEAVAVARLARQRGWKRVILVTHPWHMRRARALFLKAGLDVICSPCVEGQYDMAYEPGIGTRLNGFRNWLHETLGIAVYHLRGWI